MSHDLTIRQYKPPDAERVWAIHERALQASPLEFVEDAPADEDLTNISEQYLSEWGEFLVGLVDGEIVAIGGFQPRGSETAEIQRMRVHPEYQRQGFGERLLGMLEYRAKERGFNQVVLDTNEHLGAAQCLYQNHGYEETHREIHQPTGEEFVYYQKDLCRDT